MMRWQLIFPTIAALASASFGQVISGPDNPPVQLNIRPVPQQLIIQGGDIQINGNLQFQGNIRVQGGVLILNGPAAPDLPFSPDQLPIVNEGFANDKDVAGPITPLVDALHSSNYAAREDATEALLRLPPARLDQVVEALSKTTDPESIERLTQAAAHLYLKPRTLLKTKTSLFGVWFVQPSLALLGMKFRMDPVRLNPKDEDPTMTVMVTEIQPGFPATQTLRNGDRIIAIGGVGFPGNLAPEDSAYFRTRVAALWPGAVVPMTILRGGKVQEIGVQVAGLPVSGPSTPDQMVQLRAAALDAFLHSLKTGDKSPVLITANQATPSPAQFPVFILNAPQQIEIPQEHNAGDADGVDALTPLQPGNVRRN